MGWFDLHPKIKAAAATLGLIGLAEVVAVVQGAMTLKEAGVAFVVAAAPVVAGWLKSAGAETIDLPVDTVDPALDGDDSVANG